MAVRQNCPAHLSLPKDTVSCIPWFTTLEGPQYSSYDELSTQILPTIRSLSRNLIENVSENAVKKRLISPLTPGWSRDTHARISSCTLRVTFCVRWCRFQLAIEVWIYFSYLEFWLGAEIGTLPAILLLTQMMDNGVD